MRALEKRPIFYVYEHWRPDTGECFWVGKGYGARAWLFRKRNRLHRAVIEELRQKELRVEVRIHLDKLSEEVALAQEIERVAFWRFRGAPLANLTAGGSGVAGHRHSPATRAVIREKRKRQRPLIHTEESKRRIGENGSIARRGRPSPNHAAVMKGRKQSSEQTAKIVAKLIGRIQSSETRAKIGAANRGRKPSELTRALLRQSHLGKKHTTTTLAKMSASLRQRAALKRELCRQF
jgi:hypothetical protein